MTFDKGKESAHMLCKDKPEGKVLLTLGVLFGDKLIMKAAVREMVTKAQWRLRVLERSTKYSTALQKV